MIHLNKNITKNPINFICFFIKFFFWPTIFICILNTIIDLQSTGGLWPYLMEKAQSTLINNAIPSFNLKLLMNPHSPYYYFFLIVSSSILVYILRFITNNIYGWVVASLELNIRTAIIYHITKFPLQVFYQYNEGYISNCIDILAEETSELMRNMSFDIIPCILCMVVQLVTLLKTSKYFFFLSILWAMVHFILVYHLSKITIKYNKQKTKISHQRNGLIVENIRNILTIKIYNLNQYIYGKITDIHDQESKAKRKYLFIDSMNNLLLSGICVMLQIVFFFYFCSKLNLNHPGALYTKAINNFYFMWTVRDFTDKTINVIDNIGQIAQSIKFLQLTNNQEYKYLPSVKLKGTISFNNFNYINPRKVPIIKNCNGVINKGDVVGLFGISGSGKSTIFHILTKLIDITDNCIKFDDYCINELDPQNIRQYVTLITQQSQLFNQSIKENIQLGNLQATEQEIYQALDRACLSTTINNLPQQLETQIGANNSTVSVGQAQRISIARAFIKKTSQILLTDEITAALDPISSKVIIDMVVKYCKKNNLTIILSSHFPYVASIADKILFLSSEKTILDTHQNLLLNSKEYKNFITLDDAS